MIRDDYFPTNDDALVSWYSNLAAKLPNYRVAVGFDAATVAALQDDATMVQYLITQYKGQFDSARTLVTSFANGMLHGGIAPTPFIASYPVTPEFGATMVAPDIEGRTRALVKRIKAAPGYTEMMGHDLGLIATVTPVDLTAPTLEVTPLAGRKFRIKWRKGAASGLEVFVDFGSDYPAQGQVLTEPDQTFTVIGAVGTAPLSAKVKAMYQRKGEAVGEFGPTYSTLLLP